MCPHLKRGITASMRGRSSDTGANYIRVTLTRRMRVVIANVSPPLDSRLDYRAEWAGYEPPPREPRNSLFEQPHDWGFHIYAIGVHLLDLGEAHQVEFWDYTEERRVHYLSNGVLRVALHNDEDAAAYLEATGDPDLLVNHGPAGAGILRMLEGRCFRVHVVLNL